MKRAERLTERRMAPKKPAAKKAATVKPKAPAPAKPVGERPVHDLGTDRAVIRLTGARATKGRTGDGAPNYVYEVEWRGKYRASLLGGRPRLRRQAAARRGQHALRPFIHQDER